MAGALPHSRARDARLVVLAGATALVIALGIGRFAFTPILPMMLHDGVLGLPAGSVLATANYIGYLAGALLCAVLPRTLPPARMVKASLAATVLLTLAMRWDVPLAWPLLRLLAGIASAVAFVFTSGLCLARLGALGRPEWGAAIYAGPGAGIVLSGLLATALVAADATAAGAWTVFAASALLLTAVIWRSLGERPAPLPVQAAARDPQPVPARGSPIAAAPSPLGERAALTFAYGLAGFGYIITATFLPVIARQTLPPSVWLDLFFPVLGAGTVSGALLAARLPPRYDPRHVLAFGYLLQAAGIALGIVLPTLSGFLLGSFLVGLPFTALSFFAMQEARRLCPDAAARFMGLLTGVYGIGQIAGPLLVGILLRHTAQAASGFTWSLLAAIAALLAGAAIFAAMSRVWPIPARGGHLV